MRLTRRILSGVLVAAGLALIAWPAAIAVYGDYAQRELARQFAAEEADDPAAGETPAPEVKPLLASTGIPTPTEKKFPATPAKKNVPKTPPRKKSPTKTGDPVARLRIPSIDLEAIVIEGVSVSTLRRGPGRLPGTARPGENGNCAIAAHRAHWFRRVPELKKGDAVWLDTPHHTLQYAVTERKVVTPDRGDLLQRANGRFLTLITCDVPRADAPYRVLVFCRLAATFER